jgi:hypothetical protein
MLRVWGKLWKNGRIAEQITIENDDRRRTEQDRFDQCFEAIIHALDLAKPIWLPQNTREMQRFRRTEFRQEHFIEHFPYKKFEIEIIETDEDETE